jgi:hypothetical protein
VQRYKPVCDCRRTARLAADPERRRKRVPDRNPPTALGIIELIHASHDLVTI